MPDIYSRAREHSIGIGTDAPTGNQGDDLQVDRRTLPALVRVDSDGTATLTGPLTLWYRTIDDKWTNVGDLTSDDVSLTADLSVGFSVNLDPWVKMAYVQHGGTTGETQVAKIFTSEGR